MTRAASNAANGKGRGGAVAGMAACYALGNFTDNFFKQVAILMAAALAMTELQSLAAVLFSLPFILFSSWAGWLADRLPKRHVVIGSKFIELLALCLGAVALWQAWWPGILAVIFLMALQSTLFNPALNGAIPEFFPEREVPRVNALIRLASTVAILAGVACAGFFLDMRGELGLPVLGTIAGDAFGRVMAGAFAVFISVVGVLAAFTIGTGASAATGFDSRLSDNGVAAAAAGRAFPWYGPVDSLRDLLACRKDRQLFTAMTGDAFFYGLAAIALISIANMSARLGYSDTITGLLSAAIMVGIAIGSLISGRWPAQSWRKLMVPALTALGVCMILCSFTPRLPDNSLLQVLWFGGTLLAAGIWGGIYLIPITSFIQIRAGENEKGKIIGTVNFFSFTSMALSGALFSLLGKLEPSHTFLIYGLACLVFAHAYIRPRLRRMDGMNLKDKANSLLGLILKALLWLRYKVREQGLDNITREEGPQRRPILFLPNHPALIDPIIIYSRLAGLKPRPLSDENRMQGPFQRILVRLLGIVTIPDPEKDRRASVKLVREGLTRIRDTLKRGENILLYPSGRIYREDCERLGGNSAVAWLLREVPEARVVLVRTTGLWGSRFSRAGGKDPHFFYELFRGAALLAANLLFFIPRRPVSITFYEPDTLPPARDKMELNREIEAYYNKETPPALHVPYHFLSS